MKPSRVIYLIKILLGSLAAISSAAWAQNQADGSQEHPQNTNIGIYLFAEHCGSCHDEGRGGAEDRYSLGRHTPEEVLEKLTTGSMAPIANGMTDMEKRVVAVYVGGRPFGAAAAGDAARMKNHCVSQPVEDALKGSAWNGWGLDQTNSRFQPDAGFSADQLPRLKLKWAFGFPEGNSAYGQPSIVGGRVYIGADTGFVYSLDAMTGCVYWSFNAYAGVRTTVTIGPAKRQSDGYLAYFGDVKGNVYALNAATGAKVWMQRADKHPVARVVGSPTLVQGRLYVTVASLEESSGGNPHYPCCTFRGAVASYDAISGKQIWKSYTIAEKPKPLKKTSLGTQLWGPAGAGIWSAPTIDLKRKAVYVATGNSYTYPAVESSDAVLAFSLESGKQLWVKQLLEKDAFVRDCPTPAPGRSRSETCPDEMGPDMDFGNAPMLRTLSDGRSLVFIGQKNGWFWALDPDKRGNVVWQIRLGDGRRGAPSIQWGSAADNTTGYVPIADARKGAEAGGVSAVRLASGQLAWRGRPPVPDCDPGEPNCSLAQMAPTSVMPGVVFGGNIAGTIIAYSTADGSVLWKYNTAREFSTVNGVAANGGSMNGSGPVMAGGMLFVPSGYSDLARGMRGNVLLAFGVD